jgi:ABC-2 type transport system ATP-binding protein
MIEDSSVVMVEKLSKSFGSFTAVRDLSFSLEKGSLTGLLGGNGAGKTTTISMLLGLLKPSSGIITIFGDPFHQNREKILSRMNFCSPYVDLPQRLTVRENLSVFARLYQVFDPVQRIEELAGEFKLGDFIDKPVRRLSSGQKTRVTLVKALINKPEFLLLDEPTASLSPDVSIWIRERLKNYRDQTGATILFASHDMREVEMLCDRVLIMNKGSLIDQGSPGELMEKYQRKSLEEVFLSVSEER